MQRFRLQAKNTNDNIQSYHREKRMVGVAEEHRLNHGKITSRNAQASRCRHCCTFYTTMVAGRKRLLYQTTPGRHGNQSVNTKTITTIKKDHPKRNCNFPRKRKYFRGSAYQNKVITTMAIGRLTTAHIVLGLRSHIWSFGDSCTIVHGITSQPENVSYKVLQ